MDTSNKWTFIFTLAKELKRSYDKPVIMLTNQDYCDGILSQLVQMNNLVESQAAQDRLSELSSSMHLEWLQQIQEIEQFKRRIRDIPRECFAKTIRYTIECIQSRQDFFNMYVDRYQSHMNAELSYNLQEDIQILLELQENVKSMLKEKEKILNSYADHNEFHSRISDEADELMNWLDVMYDNVAIQHSKMVTTKSTSLLGDLAKSLCQIIDEVADINDPVSQKIAKEMHTKQEQFCCIYCLNATDDQDIKQLQDKIKVLENRIERLRDENSLAVLALEHKTYYLEDRLHSLEDLKMSLYTLKQKQHTDDPKHICENPVKFQEAHMFEHLLPHHFRCNLVQEYVKIWDSYIWGIQEGKSIISILSATDIKEIFSDEFGRFTVDKYGRKLYKSDRYDSLYQVNHENQLVPIRDDDRHVYFYDDCGRYYLNEKKQRIYKAFDSASEYFINHEGILLKLKEKRDGVEYFFDQLGRYYLDENNKRIYSEDGSDEKFEHDGLGNLVRICETESVYVTCQPEPMVTEENLYLQTAVGMALKKCIADLILRQPEDPIKYLADALVKYRRNMEDRQRLIEDQLLIKAEQEKLEQEKLLQLPDTKSESSDLSVEAETIPIDYNFVRYKGLEQDF